MIDQQIAPLPSGSTQLRLWQERANGVANHLVLLLNLSWGILVGLPWLAPILLKMNATGAARAIYLVYGFLCHQLANRSFFLFGRKWMYSYTELLPYAADANTWLGLRAFVGTAELGYKVAWSDRMVSLYGGILLGGILYALARRWFWPLRWKLLLAMAAPVALDGVTHALSDLSGVGRGFRYTNAWLASLTQHALSQDFTVGNALGSFNFWMRLLTGLLGGLATAWTLYPLLDVAIKGVRESGRSRVDPTTTAPGIRGG